jgi:hypothetical protein
MPTYYQRVDTWTSEFDSELRSPALSAAGLREILEAIQRLDAEGHLSAGAYIEENLPSWLQGFSEDRPVWAVDLPLLGRRITFVILPEGGYRLLSSKR